MSRTCKQCGSSLTVKEAVTNSKLCAACSAKAGMRRARTLPAQSDERSSRSDYVKANFRRLIAAELKEQSYPA